MTQPASVIPLAPPPIVLLVEDDPDTREMYHTALEVGGYWVVNAPDAGDALDSALDVRPDVIVTDIGLPGPQDGIGLARRLRDNTRTAAIPLLAVTGRDPRSLGDSRSLFDLVLLKPVLPDALIARIGETLAHASQLRERSASARARVSELIERSEQVLAKSQRIVQARAVSARVCACPRCGEGLIWAERRKILGVTFDYYQPCAKGCGLFCYNHSDRTIVSLTD